MKEFLITGGHVYDPATHGWSRRDIAVEGGKIVNAEVCRNSGSGEYTVIHGEGCIITTGLTRLLGVESEPKESGASSLGRSRRRPEGGLR